MTKKIIIDYGCGNVESIKRAFYKVDQNFIISNDIREISKATHLVLPGVGAFKNAADKLKQYGFFEIIKKHSQNKLPLLGICLGMQLLFSKSFEFGENSGLDIFKGEVKKIKTSDSSKYKVPNIGWYSLEPNNKLNEEDKLNIHIKSKFYHVHSFYCDPKETENVSHYINFNNKKICVIVRRNNTLGVQFHPEKSREDGLKILKFFGNL